MNNAQAKGVQKIIPFCVIICFAIMTTPINFDHHLFFRTIKNNNVITDNFLSIKIQPEK